MAEFDMAELSPSEIYKLLIGSIVPRPIAWVSCASAAGGRNIAPFSYFNAVSSLPPMVGFSVAAPKVPEKIEKDTLGCVRQTGEFVVNLASVELLDQVVITSVEFGASVDEFTVAGLTAAPGIKVRAPRIAEAPVSFECRLHTIVELGPSSWVIGEVVHAHVRDGLLDEHMRMDVEAFRPIGRMPGPAFTTEMNMVTRAVRLAGENSGVSAELDWLGPPVTGIA